MEVTVAGVNGKDQVKCSRDIIIVPDLSLGEASAKGPYDVVILPGGLGGSKILAEVLNKFIWHVYTIVSSLSHERILLRSESL